MNKRTLKSYLACALSFVLIFGMTLPFFARKASAAKRTYTIRVFAGEQGMIEEDGKLKSMVEYSNIEPGTSFFFGKTSNGVSGPSASDDVKVSNDKYYVKGFRLSGRDNNELELGAITVNGDADYVVAYGVKGSTVEYTVMYLEYPSGNELHPSETFVGNDGDRPVVAYKYIEGYFPNARNQVGKIEKGKDNTFIFYYQPIVEPTTATEETTETTESTESSSSQTTTQAQRQQTQQAPSGQTTIIERTVPAATTTQSSNPTTPATTAAPGTATTAANDGTGTATTEAEEDTNDLPDNPDDVPDLVDIDDQDTPLADFDDDSTEDDTEDTTEAANITDEETPRSGLSTPAKVGIGIGCIAAIAAAAGGLYYFLVYRQSPTADGADEDDSEDESDEE